MSVVTKAAVAVLAQFIYASLPSAIADKVLLPIWVIAAVSRHRLGNVGMLAQHDLKRLIAYSGVAQVGYILTALAGGTPLGMRYAIYYLTAYTFMNLGAFAVAAMLSGDREEGSRLANYRGPGWRRPVAAMTFFLLAMAGVPPTAGFLGKILILATSVSAGYAWLGVALIVGTAISLYAYAKVIRAMYARDEHAHPHDALRSCRSQLWISAVACCIIVIAMTFYPPRHQVTSSRSFDERRLSHARDHRFGFFDRGSTVRSRAWACALDSYKSCVCSGSKTG